MKTEIINFYSHELAVFRGEDGITYVVIKSICDAIGLNMDSVGRAIKSDEILGAEHTIQSVQVGQNQAREYLCLPIEYVQGWLFMVETGKVKTEIKETFITFKRECYRAMSDYFSGKTGQVVKNAERRFEILKEMERLKNQKYGIDQRLKDLLAELNNLDTDTFTQLNLFTAPKQIEIAQEEN